MSLTILIPALNPSDGLIGLVDALTASDEVREIIVVNDGSNRSFDGVFDETARRSKVTLLRHAVNLGKGAALRTGMNHFCCEGTEASTLVTADADGQHLPDDILKVGRKGLACPEDLVLGVRSFASDVPLRSRFGNTLTYWVFRLLVGQELQDTQTGLRAIPRSMIPLLLKVRAMRYEFEMEMLIRATQHRIQLVSVPIQTVYLRGNQSSHFRPVVDSVRVYSVFARFLVSSF
jgi:glycosyltransferase involved in cell wall biosynthesis